MESDVITRMQRDYSKRGMAFTEQQAEMTVKAMRDQMARMMGTAAAAQMMLSQDGMAPAAAAAPMFSAGTAPASAPATVAVPETSTTGDNSLAEQLAQIPPKSGDVAITERREGFTVNGMPVIDPQGSITMYAYDIVSGDITFGVAAPDGLIVKFMRAGAPNAPIVIATGTNSASGWVVRTAEGQPITGQSLSMLPRGLLVARPGAAFQYEPGNGLKSIPIPDGYTLAPIQRGNVGKTGFLLIKRDDATGNGSALSQRLSAFKAIGAAVGVMSKQDYAFFDSNSGELIPLNVSAEGENVTVMTDCQKRARFLNECASGHSFESLYSPSTGMRNINHYYWRAHWLNTEHGPIAVTLENGAKEIFIIDLRTGERALAFRRALGIADMEVIQQPNGTVEVHAQLAFSKKSIPDAVAFLKTAGETVE